MKRILSIIILVFLIFFVASKAKAPTQEAKVKVYSGVSPHHLLAQNIIDNFYYKLSNLEKIDNIVLLSPDHFHQCEINNVDFITLKSDSIKEIAANKEIIDGIKEMFSVFQDDSTVLGEHGISNHIYFIKKYFPESKIVPLIISQRLSEDSSRKIGEFLSINLPNNSFISASVDFSHYLPKEIASIHDEKSIRVLVNFEEDSFKNIEVDSPQALFISRYYAKLKGADSLLLTGKGNSEDYIKEEISETTSYFSAIFGKGLKEKITEKTTKTFLFTGDIMLDRNVNKLMLESGYDYPFEKIERVLSGIDFTIGNLEGPIVYNKKPYLYNSLSFSFSEDTARALRNANFNILSLANNHTENQGQSGLRETREILEKNSIIAIGDPELCNKNFVYKNGDVIFAAFNLVYSINNELIGTIQELRENNKNSFIIALLHWGNEYSSMSSSSQRTIAHEIADCGADLIIGSHPHVVQEVELYQSSINNKRILIFYSLGNFIFDQYFSKETQEGLVVGLIKNESDLEFVLIPVKLPKSQPQLMTHDEKKIFLINLSKNSSEEIQEQVEQGIINIKN